MPLTEAGHLPGRCPLQDPLPIEVFQDRHDVATARPGHVAECRRRQRLAPRDVQRLGGKVAVRGHGVGQIAVEHDDTTPAFQLANGRGRAAGHICCLAQRGWSHHRERGLQAVHRGLDLSRDRGRHVIRGVDGVGVPGQEAIGNDRIDDRRGDDQGVRLGDGGAAPKTSRDRRTDGRQRGTCVAG